MTSQKAASLSLFARTGSTVRTRLSFPVRQLALMLLAGLALPTPTAVATESLNTRMYLMGEQACQQVFDAGANSALGGVDYRSSAEKLGLEPEFCYCVGRAFMHYAPNQSARLEKAGDETAYAEIFIGILRENLNMCLNADSFLYFSDLFGGDYDPWAIKAIPPGQEEDDPVGDEASTGR